MKTKYLIPSFTINIVLNMRRHFVILAKL